MNESIKSRRATTCGMETSKNSPRGATSFINARRGSTLIHQEKKSRTSYGAICGDESPFDAKGPGIKFSSSPSVLSEEKKRKVANRILNFATAQSSPARIGGFESPLSAASHCSESINNSSGKEDGYVTAHELLENNTRSRTVDDWEDSYSRLKSSANGYRGFSITKSDFWRSSGASSTCSPVPDARREISQRFHSADPNGGNAAVTTTAYLPASPETPLVARQKVEIENYIREVQALKATLRARDEELTASKEALSASEEAQRELDSRRQMAQEEVETCAFISSLQEQRFGELEEQISTDRFERHELLSSKTRKHKVQVKKLQQERADYEARANQMIQQMTDQMGQLQKMAMTRIETLEKELMTQRHNAEKWQSECIRLQSALAGKERDLERSKEREKVARAMRGKENELNEAVPMASPATEGFRRARRAGRCSSTNSHFRSSADGRSRASTCSSRSSCTVVHCDDGADDCHYEEDGGDEEDERDGEGEDGGGSAEMDDDDDESSSGETEVGGTSSRGASNASLSPTGKMATVKEVGFKTDPLGLTAAAAPQIEVDIWNAYI